MKMIDIIGDSGIVKGLSESLGYVRTVNIVGQLLIVVGAVLVINTTPALLKDKETYNETEN